jgi:hypothetical protein
MKTTLASVVVFLVAICFDHARLAAEDTQSADMRLYPTETIEWKPGPAALPPGAKMAVLEGDPTREGPFVISGTLYLATGEALDRNSAKKLPTGSFGYWPAGMKHAGWSEGDTVIQLHGVGPWQINYVNPADDPRNLKKSPGTVFHRRLDEKGQAESFAKTSERKRSESNALTYLTPRLTQTPFSSNSKGHGNRQS